MPPPAPDVRTTGVQAVLWDMDGTLLDTEPYWMGAESALVREFGGRWTDEDAYALVGNALPDSARILQAAGVTLSVREIIDRLSAEVCAGVSREVMWRPGAIELLHELRAASIPCALVTMSEGPLAALVTSLLPAGLFRFHVTGDMVARGKPDPEPYLMALESMGALVPDLDPRRVVAIEDSIPGILSASASGATAVAVPHLSPIEPSSDWALIDSLSGFRLADLDRLVADRISGAFPSAAAMSGTGA